MASFTRLFVDTSFILGIYNTGDQFHQLCVDAMPVAQKARELVVTDAVLLEIGNAFSSINRRAQGARIIRDFLGSPGIAVIHLTPEYFESALTLL